MMVLDLFVSFLLASFVMNGVRVLRVLGRKRRIFNAVRKSDTRRTGKNFSE